MLPMPAPKNNVTVTRGRKMRRALVHVVAWCLFGFTCSYIIAIAVSVGIVPLARIGEREDRTHVDGGTFSGNLVWERGIGFDIVIWDVNYTGNALSVTTSDLNRALSALQYPYPLPTWLGWPRQLNPPEGAISTLAVGWPVRFLRSGSLPREDGFTRSLCGALRIDAATSQYEIATSPVTGRSYRIERWPHGTLPVSIIWTGLVLNLVIIGSCGAIVSSIVTTVYVAIRSSWWQADNRCPTCGYSTLGLGGRGIERCPECGTLER